MANQQTVDEFFVQLGLNLSELESGFVEANRTISQNIGRLNREANLIQIRSQVELAGLDEAEDAERILQIRTDALNQRMAIQRDRIRLVSAEVRNLTVQYGENNIVTQQAQTRLEQTRLRLAQMERELRSLNSPSNEGSLVRFQAALSNVGEGLGGLLRADITPLLERMPPQFKAVAAGIGAVATGAGVAHESVDALLADFRELHQQSYELNMSVGRTRDFLRQLRLGGGDIGDFEGYIRGITDAFVKGEADDPEFIALSKYGAVITDAAGRLKDFKAIADEVYQAFKRADEAGEGIEFLQLTGGESGIRDAIQFFRRYEEAVADAQKIVQSNINETQLHELDRVMKLVEEQATELKNALGDIFVPVAQSAAESFFETLRAGTKLLTDNKDAIQSLGFVAKETFQTVGNGIKDAWQAAGDKISAVNELISRKTGNSHVDKILGDMSWRYGGLKQAYGVDAMITGQVRDAEKSYGMLDGIIERAKQKQAEYNEELKKTAEQIAATEKELDRNPLNQYAVQRVQQFKDELADLRIDLDYESEIDKARARLDLWFEREFTRKNYLSEAEESAIRDLYSARLEQINSDYQSEVEAAMAKVQEHWKNAAEIEYDLTHTAYEKQIRDIELWKEAKIEAGEDAAAIVAEAAAKETQVFEREVDRIKGLTKSFEDEIFEMEHSRYESDLRRAIQKAQEGLADGAPLEIVQYWLSRKKAEFDARARESQEKGGDYAKSPTGLTTWNGIPQMQYGISLMTQENQIRSQLLDKLDEATRAEAERINTLKANLQMPSLSEQFAAFQGAAIGDKTIIEGDTLTQISLPDLKAEMQKALEQTQMTFALPPQLETALKAPSVQPPQNYETQITVSPTINVDLGGAYVFDDALKAKLTDDITTEIVDNITSAVRQATSNQSYSYGN